MKRRLSSNYDERPPGTPIDMLVLHYTGMQNAEAAIDRLCDPDAQVSAHYLIDEDGTILQLVEEGYRAWHAGESCWRGHRDINARSIGIELVNPGHEFGYRPFFESQMRRLETVALDIVRRHQIPARNVVGHSDIAPRRKEDPGELFDWFRIFDLGVGCWPDRAAPCNMDEGEATILLQSFGYETIDMPATLKAFQSHFRPANISGKLDHETAGLLKRLPS